MTSANLLLGFVVCASAAVVWWLQAQRRAERARHARELEAQRERHAVETHAQAARLETMLDGMVEGLVVLDAAGRIALVNRAAEKLFNFSRMMVGGSLLQATRNHEVAALAARAEDSAGATEQEIRLETPETRVLRVSAAALRNPAGAATGTVLVFHDITQLRLLEAMRQDFVANVSHELRTPLSLIKSAAETLQDGGKEDPAIATRFLEIIDKNANRLTLLIDDLLLLARLDSGRVEMDFAPVCLHESAQEALEDAERAARARGVTLRNTVPADLYARADAHRLRQVLTNLVDNAIKYGRPEGTVVLAGRRREDGRVEFSVRDDGPGIAPEHQRRVFERFYRVDKARSREQGGTGLGLAIVKNVVQAHEGEVRVESVPGAGTEFFVTLPGATPGE